MSMVSTVSMVIPKLPLKCPQIYGLEGARTSTCNKLRLTWLTFLGAGITHTQPGVGSQFLFCDRAGLAVLGCKICFPPRCPPLSEALCPPLVGDVSSIGARCRSASLESTFWHLAAMTEPEPTSLTSGGQWTNQNRQARHLVPAAGDDDLCGTGMDAGTFFSC